MAGDEKVSPGQKVAGSAMRDSATVNGLLDLLHLHRRGQLSGLGRTKQPAPLSTNLVMVKNLTGSTRSRGDVLQLGDFLLTDEGEESYKWHRWFEADEHQDRLLRCVILAEPAIADAIVPAHASGVCVARVSGGDISMLNDTHAKPVPGSYLLETCKYRGPFELLTLAQDNDDFFAIVRFTYKTPHFIAEFNKSGTSGDAAISAYFDAAGLDFTNEWTISSNQITIPAGGVYRVKVQGEITSTYNDAGPAESYLILKLNGSTDHGLLQTDPPRISTVESEYISRYHQHFYVEHYDEYDAGDLIGLSIDRQNTKVTNIDVEGVIEIEEI